MKCYKCGKEMEREDGQTVQVGMSIDIEMLGIDKTPENIEYSNKQLCKYNNGNGECHIAICLECHVDGLLQVK